MVGFRKAFDVFPEEIYYYATEKEKEEYYAKLHDKFPQDYDIPKSPDHLQGEPDGTSQEPKLDLTTSTSEFTVTQLRAVDQRSIQQIQEVLERQQQERHEDLKRELQISREQIVILQEQLRSILAALEAKS
jgi:hypothetical protein